MKNPWEKGKIWTQAELDEWAALRLVKNAEYQKESLKQLDEWVKGNSVHNHLSPINAVEDADGKIVGYFYADGGECCPDFSCCGVKGWPIEQRKKFMELHHSGNESACHEMLMGSLHSLSSETEKNIYISGQAGETQH